MLSEEIKNLYQQMDERIKARAKQKADSNKDDEHIAQIADTPGWEVVKGQVESMIIEMLEPVEFTNDTPLDVRGAIGEARKFGLEVARKILGIVESVRIIKQAEKDEKSAKLKSEEEEVKNV